MGIGVGRPGIEDELRERGLPVTSPGQRLDQVRETVAALRALDGAQDRTPVAMAVIGPKARALAAEIADIGHLRHGAERAAGRRGAADRASSAAVTSRAGGTSSSPCTSR